MLFHRSAYNLKKKRKSNMPQTHSPRSQTTKMFSARCLSRTHQPKAYRHCFPLFNSISFAIEIVSYIRIQSLFCKKPIAFRPSTNRRTSLIARQLYGNFRRWGRAEAQEKYSGAARASSNGCEKKNINRIQLIYGNEDTFRWNWQSVG